MVKNHAHLIKKTVLTWWKSCAHLVRKGKNHAHLVKNGKNHAHLVKNGKNCAHFSPHGGKLFGQESFRDEFYFESKIKMLYVNPAQRINLGCFGHIHIGLSGRTLR